MLLQWIFFSRSVCSFSFYQTVVVPAEIKGRCEQIFTEELQIYYICEWSAEVVYSVQQTELHFFFISQGFISSTPQNKRLCCGSCWDAALNIDFMICHWANLYATMQEIRSSGMITIHAAKLSMSKPSCPICQSICMQQSTASLHGHFSVLDTAQMSNNPTNLWKCGTVGLKKDTFL